MLVLASASPRRRELMRLLGLPFDVTQTDVDETPGRLETPAAVVLRLSQAKAAAAAGIPPALGGRVSAAAIIACDTIVALESEILGKPGDAEEATAMLRRLRSRNHAVYSAITLRDAVGDWTHTDVARTDITMRRYTDAEIAAYVASGDPLDKAGAYAIQHTGFHPVADFHGCYANVVGLPLCHLARRLRERGIEPVRGLPARCQAHTGQLCTAFPDILGQEQ